MKAWSFFILILIFTSCRENYTPKPCGFYRISFPEKSYVKLPDRLPYSFDIPAYSKVVKDKRDKNEPYWINVEVPENNVQIHFSYYDLSKHGANKRKMLCELMEDTRSLAYKHSIKADAIDEQVFMNPGRRVFGTIYKIAGNAASPMQFFLTDSTNHFLRGAFYIREVPDIDSLRPVINFIEPDIIHMIETTSWNNAVNK